MRQGGGIGREGRRAETGARLPAQLRGAVVMVHRTQPVAASEEKGNARGADGEDFAMSALR